ncbi:class A beta-lactamase [Saccharothrix violaceirubra]|uniref:Beta-lactamase n=1 Tax=Saccharothrix violaceirubra TaxID=413306 RepID=A0A7W7T5E5_9PSEU|nr:class A beta-lactamase [Saccharothrix violaceirubra]MBB4966596.1 beta-lactamase class A [Saccharothrix violaceirubra]
MIVPRVVALLVLLSACSTPDDRVTATASAPPPDPAFVELERRFDAQVGVYAVDTGSNREVSYRADQRFAFASTFKALAAGLVLKAHEGGLDRVFRYSPAEIVDHSPVASGKTGLTVLETCDAAVRYSDNTAGNLLLRDLGGPKGFTAALRDLGDETTRSNRTEPTLNDTSPGDFRDTSTPRALATTLRTLLTTDRLPDTPKSILLDLLHRNTTGDKTIRAGTPEGWTVGDKTGTAAYGTRTDIAVVTPPGRAPILLAVLTTHTNKDASSDDALVAEAIRMALEHFS